MRRPGGSVGGPGGEPGPEAVQRRREGQVLLRLTPERAAQLREEAARRGLTPAALVTTWLDECGPVDPDGG